MKKLFPLLGVLMLILLSCNKDDFPRNGRGEVFKNGELWEAKAKSVFHEASSRAIIELFEEKGIRKESILLSGIPLSVGTFEIKPFIGGNDSVSCTISTILGGDTIFAQYFPSSTSADNYIKITRFDSECNEMEGEFSCLMIQDPDTYRAELPDTIILTLGKFNVDIE